MKTLGNTWENKKDRDLINADPANIPEKDQQEAQKQKAADGRRRQDADVIGAYFDEEQGAMRPVGVSEGSFTEFTPDMVVFRRATH